MFRPLTTLAARVLIALALSAWTAPAAATEEGGSGLAVSQISVLSQTIGSIVSGKWKRMLGRDWATRPEADRICSRQLGADCRLAQWQDFIRVNAEVNKGERIQSVQAFVNRTAYIEDDALWGESDYWAAPGEFFARGGDCEDFAIAKYLSLRKLGFAADEMRIAVVRDTTQNQLHAVLLVEFRGDTLVLDNNAMRVLVWEQLPHYRPLYSFNEHDFRLHRKASAA